MHVPPGSIQLHKHSPSMLHLPLWALTIGHIRNYQSSIVGAGLALGENHFLASSHTYREMLTGLTTCLFYHGPDNPILQPVFNSFPTRVTFTTVYGHRSKNGNNLALDTARSGDFPGVGLHRRHRTVHPFRFLELCEGKNKRGSKVGENIFQTEDLETRSTNATMEDLLDSHNSDNSRQNGGQTPSMAQYLG
jgi:hypothetical protein